MEPPRFRAHSVQQFALLSHDGLGWPTHPKSMLRGHAFRCQVGNNGGGGDGGGGDGGVGGGESAGAVILEQPQGFGCLHPQVFMAPGFEQRTQHSDCLYQS